MSQTKKTWEKVEADEYILQDAIEDLADNRSISIYHQWFETTINVTDEQGKYLLQALHESGFEVIPETETIYTLRYTSDNPLKPSGFDDIINSIKKES